MNQKLQQIIFREIVNLDLTVKKCNSNQWWNNGKCRCECKTRHASEKDYI